MVDYNVFSFTRAYLDHFHWINWFYCASSQTFWHTPHFWKIIISWGKVGVIHVKTFETKLVTLSLTLKLQINIFQGFPKRYCKSDLVKTFQSYIFKVGNKKNLATRFYKFEDWSKWYFAVKFMQIWTQISYKNLQ